MARSRHPFILILVGLTVVWATAPLLPAQRRSSLDTIVANYLWSEDAVDQRFRIDPNRIVSTGISLGSNFSIAFGCARPDRFAAIVPVSTEGDSREHLLRNMMHVPAYILEGTQDRNIRTIPGPNALQAILTSFGYDLTYREFGARAHEGFQEHYPDVLRWLSDRFRRGPEPHRIRNR